MRLRFTEQTQFPPQKVVRFGVVGKPRSTVVNVINLIFKLGLPNKKKDLIRNSRHGL